MFKIFIAYPTYEEEFDIATRTTVESVAEVAPVLSRAEIIELQKVVRRIPAAPPIIRHAIDLVRSSRPGEPNAPEFVKKNVAWGAGPRAVQFLILGAKARAVLRGNYYVSTEDIRALAGPVLRHRIIPNFAAQAQGYTSERLITDLLEHTPAHGGGLLEDDRIRKVFS